MELCLVREYSWHSMLELLHDLLFFLTGLFVSLFKEADDSIEAQNVTSRAVVNEQAERMLTDYGNAVLRLAYSYLHNMADAEEVLQDTLIQFIKTAPVLETKKT